MDATMAARKPSSGNASGYSREQIYDQERQKAAARAGAPRSTMPCPPENSALADELRSRLRGKPTRAAHNRHWYIEVFHAVLDVVKTVLVVLFCLGFLIGGFGGGMLIGYISSTTPLSISDISMTDTVETSFVYDINGTVIAKLTGSENVDRIYVAYTEVKDTYIDEAMYADKLSVVYDDIYLARSTQNSIREFIRNHPTVYCGTHTPQGYESLESMRAMDLDHPVETIFQEFDFAKKEATGWRCERCGKQCRKPGEPFDTHKNTLTVAHLNHTPEDVRPENLCAMCAPCHLRYDAQHHAESRVLRKAAKRNE